MATKVNDQYLLEALKINFEHARHQENLRERHAYLYWAAWGTAIAFISIASKPSGVFTLQPYYWVFFLLLMLSLALLIGTLKWSLEFANHMASVAQISVALGLNRIKEGKTKTPLPYQEFEGYIALPAQVPIIFNFAVIMSLIYCVGATLAFWLFLQGVNFVGFGMGWKVFLTLIIFLSTLLTCIYFYQLTKKVVKLRARKYIPFGIE